MQLQHILISPMTNLDITLVLKTEPLSTPSKMDISAILNQLDEVDGQGESKEIDSPPSSDYTPTNSSHNSSPSICSAVFPSPQVMQVYTQRLPSSKDPCVPPVTPRPPFENCLPPFSSLFPPMFTSGEQVFTHYSDTLETLMRDHRDRRRRFLRRKSHHSPAPPLPSPQINHRRIFRRRSHPQSLCNGPVYRIHDKHQYPQPVIRVNDHDTQYDSSSPPVVKSDKAKGSHNNKAYTKEMIMWMRYFAVDRDMKYNDMLPHFWEQFPERWDPITSPWATGQMISSRLYRDNDRPDIDENGNWGFDDKGRLKMIKSKVREQTTAEGKELNFPHTLVGKWPARLLEYDWIMPILEEDKKMAKRILRNDDPSDPQGKKAEWRRILNECEEHIYKQEN